MYTLANDEVWVHLADSENFVAILAVTVGCVVGVVGIIGGTISSVTRSKAREQTKRELAAYVAEGTIDPDKAVAILNAGMPKWETPDLAKMKGCKA